MDKYYREAYRKRKTVNLRKIDDINNQALNGQTCIMTFKIDEKAAKKDGYPVSVLERFFNKFFNQFGVYKDGENYKGFSDNVAEIYSYLKDASYMKYCRLWSWQLDSYEFEEELNTNIPVHYFINKNKEVTQ